MVVSIYGSCNFPADSVTPRGFTIRISYSAIAELADSWQIVTVAVTAVTAGVGDGEA